MGGVITKSRQIFRAPTSRFVEQQLGDPAVALWTSGAAATRTQFGTTWTLTMTLSRHSGGSSVKSVKVLRSIRLQSAVLYARPSA